LKEQWLAGYRFLPASTPPFHGGLLSAAGTFGSEVAIFLWTIENVLAATFIAVQWSVQLNHPQSGKNQTNS
jgi:hypothetical protein